MNPPQQTKTFKKEIEQLENKIEVQRENLSGEIDSQRENLSGEIDSQLKKLLGDIEAQRKDLEFKVLKTKEILASYSIALSFQTQANIRLRDMVDIVKGTKDIEKNIGLNIAMSHDFLAAFIHFKNVNKVDPFISPTEDQDRMRRLIDRRLNAAKVGLSCYELNEFEGIDAVADDKVIQDFKKKIADLEKECEISEVRLG